MTSRNDVYLSTKPCRDLVLDCSHMPQKHGDNVGRDSGSLSLQVIDLCIRFLFKALHISTRVSTALYTRRRKHNNLNMVFLRMGVLCYSNKHKFKWILTSATFLWYSASIWARNSVISFSASSFACFSLACFAAHESQSTQIASGKNPFYEHKLVLYKPRKTRGTFSHLRVETMRYLMKT